MFLLSLTYHQVLPVFLDFLFPFGDQQYPHDPYFSGFRSEDRFSTAVKGPTIPALGRSGQDIRMCYTLKSAEKMKMGERTDRDVPEWSIRQTSLYHSFDIVTGNATWIVVKGNNIIKQRLQRVTNAPQYNNKLATGELDRLLASTFAVHQVVCDWSGENWRWYLNDLEEKVQEITRHAPAVLVDSPDFKQPKGPVLRNNTHRERSQTRATNCPVLLQPPMPPPPPPPAPRLAPGPRTQYPGVKSHESPKATDMFGIRDLQKVQHIQDQAGQALLILESNANVIGELRGYYQSLIHSEGWPDELRKKSVGDIARFDKCAGIAERHLRLQYLRAKTLRSMLEDRKAMVSQVFAA